MTSIALNVTGARIQASVNGPLTSGMVGIPVTIRYDDAWNELTKNLVCRCGKWGPDRGETRTVLNIGETATVAHEVMQADMHLYLGIEGYSADGKLVIPTIWADCGWIQHGANTGADLSTDPKLSVWAQLQAQIAQLKKESITEEEIAAAVAAYLEENPITGSDSAQNGNGLTTAQITALDGMFKVCAFIKEDVSTEYAAFQNAFGISDSGDIHTHSYTSTVITVATCTTAGVRTYSCSCGSSYTENIPATGHNYVGGVCTLCGAADPNYNPDEPEKTLTGISVTYSGGSVTAGTAVTDLTGIVVTATYSDGSTATVTDYTLSGTIAEGSNTITVGYGGKTTTFTVTGIKAANDTTVVIETYDAGLANGNITTSFASGLGVSKLYEFATELTSGYEYLVGSLPYGEETPKSTNCKAALCVDGEFVYAAAMEGAGKPMNPDNTEGQASMNLSTAIFNGVRVVVAYNYADDSYLYIKSTGQVLFAGKNTPYYGMANIDGTPVG